MVAPEEKIEEFIKAWEDNSAGESATAQQHFLELCTALDVPHPTPQEQKNLIYRFEMPVKVVGKQGKGTSTEFLDVYKKDHFIWENKQGSEEGDQRRGHGRRGTKLWRDAMAAAYLQAKRYAAWLPGDPPPFLIVCDVGHHIEIWNDFSRKGKHYKKRPSRRCSYAELRDPKNVDYLRRVMTDPMSLDPASYQEEVTRKVAATLANLAKSLEGAGHAPATTSQFLMRCIFTMFAEDVELLPSMSFTKLLQGFLENPSGLTPQLEHLWKSMNDGGFLLGIGEVRKFNGGLFENPTALELTAEQIKQLHEAATHDWENVEPTVFGTLLERALDPVERHKLGAHFTPRAYIEQVVRPTVIEPLRNEWLAVQHSVFPILGDTETPKTADVKKAAKLVRKFHHALCQVRVLDPACGTGNFLFVTYDLLKDLEKEVLDYLVDLGEQRGLQLAGAMVMPAQMLGIEKNPRAREVADLVLWIGHLQRLRNDNAFEAIQEPIISESRHIHCKDAVLEWDGDRVPRLDADGNEVQVWDQRTTKTDPVTGREVPDDSAMVTIYDYPNARQAQWPQADFIVSNPPFVGAGPMRATLGNGYTEALRAAWNHIPESADLVMYWWDRAAELTRAGKILRFGLITTNSIHQTFQRRVVERHLNDNSPLSLIYAVPDHPWTAGEDSAAVRIAITIGAAGELEGTLSNVVSEQAVENAAAIVEFSETHGRIHPDLKIGADITSAIRLASNEGLSCPGVKLHGAGFIVTPEQASSLGLGSVVGLENHIRPYRNGRDLTQVPREVMVIDFFGLTAEHVFERFPSAYQWLSERVKAERDAKAVNGTKDSQKYAKLWWLHGKVRAALREVLSDLPRYIATVETAKHRFFQFLPAEVLPDNMLVAIGLSDGTSLGVLSSRIHVTWALGAGGRLGIGNDPRYNKTKCFDPFPFPDLSTNSNLRDQIGQIAERLDAHRKQVQELDRKAGQQTHLTNQYNALVRARDARTGGEPLTDKERAFHEGALIGILHTIHDELDAAVAEAYGWPVDLTDEQILENLVALNHERAEEEAKGVVRWLRPEFQAAEESPEQTSLPGTSKPTQKSAKPQKPDKVWPQDTPSRMLAIRDLLRMSKHPLSAKEVAAQFKGGRVNTIRTYLENLTALGVLEADEDELYSLA